MHLVDPWKDKSAINTAFQKEIEDVKKKPDNSKYAVGCSVLIKRIKK